MKKIIKFTTVSSDVTMIDCPNCGDCYAFELFTACPSCGVKNGNS